jgi:hypothetical protein
LSKSQLQQAAENTKKLEACTPDTIDSARQCVSRLQSLGLVKVTAIDAFIGFSPKVLAQSQAAAVVVRRRHPCHKRGEMLCAPPVY